MELFDSVRDFIRQADDKELYTYGGLIAGSMAILFFLLVYFHYSRVSWHKTEFKKLDSLRQQTRRILQDAT